MALRREVALAWANTSSYDDDCDVDDDDANKASGTKPRKSSNEQKVEKPQLASSETANKIQEDDDDEIEF